MANLDFPSNPSNNDTYVINGTTYVYNSTKGYWRIQTATSLEDLTLTGSLTVAGTVDGRDVSVDGTKLDGIEAGADVTDTANVTAAGALMDSEVTNLAAVKAFDPTDYATAAQGTLADSSVQPGDSPSFVNITVSGTVDGRDVATDGTKLDGIEAGATADQTKADIDALGIDAATLGGNAASYFTGYTDTAISNLVDTAPTTLDTLNELAAALGDDPNFATTVTNSIGGKVAKSGDTMTGDLTVPNLIVTGTVDGRDVSVDGTKLDGIEAGADVTDTANVTAAGALMDSEVTNLAAVKAFDPTDYATAAQGTLAASAVQPGDNISTLINDSGFTTNTGTVTSVAASVPTGFTVAGTPVTSSGTLAISYSTGYQGYTTTEATKLSGIEAGAQVNVGTDLGNSATGSSFTITSSTGNNTNLPAATTSAWGIMTDNDKTKLDGIEASADVTDAGNVNPLVDAHLNTSTATTNQVLSWTGSDYDWVDQSGGGGGALNDLTDVTITSPATGQLIVYNGTNSQWENSGSASFDDIGVGLNGSFTFIADDGSGVVQLKGPATVPDLLQVFKIPGDDGANGDVLTTDGNGNLSFTTPSGGGGGITTGKAIAMAMVFG
jgi:hypothetical protein